jgi:hypothetical protein
VPVDSAKHRQAKESRGTPEERSGDGERQIEPTEPFEPWSFHMLMGRPSVRLPRAFVDAYFSLRSSRGNEALTSYAGQGFSADLRRRLRPGSRGRESAQTRLIFARAFVREPPDVGCYELKRVIPPLPLPTPRL